MIERNQVEAAITTLEGQPYDLAEGVLETILTVLRQQLDLLDQAKTTNAALKGERKQITVMFADISGFTAMSEKLDPEEVRNLINACFEQLGAVIERYDGYIDKFIGDEIMALFGAPVAHENDPERALRAALDMMSTLEGFNTRHADKIPKPLALHFGINTGLAIAGGIGTADRQDYSVMGDPVNLAARLESLSEAGQILVGEQTYRLTTPLFEFDSSPPVKVKGKEKPVRVYCLLRVSATCGQIRGIEGLNSDLVGRKEELERLQRALINLQQGRGGVISIVGDAGLGKSRLVREIYRAFQSSAVAWARGRALSYGQNASYYVARDALYNILDLAPENSTEEIDTALNTEISHLFPEQIPEIYPYLAHLLEIPLDKNAIERVKYLSGVALQKRIFQAVKKYISTKAAQKPLVLTLDDLHWADPSSLNLLQELLPLTQLHPLLLLLIYRPVRDGRIWAFHNQINQLDYLTEKTYRCLELSPLTPEESHHLVMNLMGSSEKARNIRDLIVRKAEGNPFYVEEVIRSLINNKTLIRADTGADHFIIDGAEKITIPDTLQGVIMARIDQLDPETKRTLQVASVIGRTFPHQILVDVLDKLNLYS